MKLFFFVFCSVTFLTIGGALGEDLKLIHLNDGSSIRAEVLSLNKGVYTLQSSSMGRIQIDAAKIAAITNPGQATRATNNDIPTGADGVNMDRMSKELMNDPDMMKKIMSMQNDPALKDVLNNPDIMRLISSNDFGALANRPEIQQLMKHPIVQEIKTRGVH